MIPLPVSNHSRLAPEARKLLLIEATLDCLRRFGLQNTSVRKVAELAGVSPGLIVHHFKSKDELVAEAYIHLTQLTLQHIQTAIDAAGHCPRKRLEAYCRAYLGDHTDDTALLEYWIAFWGAVRTQAQLQEVHDRSFGAYQTLLEDTMQAFGSSHGWQEFDAPQAARLLSGLLDGLWLAAGLRSQGQSANDGMTVCLTWLDSLEAGGHSAFQVLAPQACAGA